MTARAALAHLLQLEGFAGGGVRGDAVRDGEVADGALVQGGALALAHRAIPVGARHGDEGASELGWVLQKLVVL